MQTRYTTIAARDLPFPAGLGKSEYPTLERAMKRLLGTRHDDTATNAAMFWTPQYQALIRKHLKPHFDHAGDIVAIARAAATEARASALFDHVIPGDGYAAYERYIVGLPAHPADQPNGTAREIARWIHNPPSLYSPDGTTFLVDNGRHRLSLLRSEVERTDPNFQVLVEITSD